MVNPIICITILLCYYIDCWGLTTRLSLWVVLSRLLEKGRWEIEETVEGMNKRDRREMKINDSEETEEI